MALTKSPIRISDLNPISEQAANDFYRKTNCDGMLIMARNGSTWHFQELNLHPFDKLQIAQNILDDALKEISEDL